MKKMIAGIFSHPDDEVLGAGGALKKHSLNGDDVRILILSTGLTSREPAKDAEILELRKQAQASADVLGLTSIEFADFPDNKMDSVPLLDVVKRVEEFLDSFNATTIYTHHGNDLNIDHRITYQAVLTACRPLPGSGPREILACEINSATEWGDNTGNLFIPSDFLNIENTLKSKIEALSCYKSEIRDWPHPRSLEAVEGLAKLRGSQSGFTAAEAYQVIKRVRN
jgi:N-acetylglucosamine malate deacetylase 1